MKKKKEIYIITLTNKNGIESVIGAYNCSAVAFQALLEECSPTGSYSAALEGGYRVRTLTGYLKENKTPMVALMKYGSPLDQQIFNRISAT